MELQAPKPVNPVDSGPTYGDIIICGSCMTVNITDVLGTHPVSDEELAAFDDQTKSDLDFALRFKR